MKTEQIFWASESGWSGVPSQQETAQLVFIFGATDALEKGRLSAEISSFYPNACCVGCTTAGEIFGTTVLDGAVVVTAVAFEHSFVRGARVSISEAGSSFAAGEQLAGLLEEEGLVHAFVLSDGLNINGTDLVEGLRRRLPPSVSVTGGLAGDGDRFGKTLVLYGDAAETDTVAIIGLYGERLRIGYGSMGGWDPFGPERLITRSQGNVLHELDGKSALELYTRYLGEHAKGLPASGLLFPLSIRTPEREAGVVRTILAINEKEQSMTFAGDIPEGSYARFMKANFERLIDGATGAAATSFKAVNFAVPDLAILISCVGRKLVLRQRIEEEVESVRGVLGKDTVLAGFYSYGEISPFTPGAHSELHNQTMTVTTISEC